MTASPAFVVAPPFSSMAADPVHHTSVVDACLGVCVQCGGTDRLFVETERGIVSHCYRCGDESLKRRRPLSCPGGAGDDR